MGTTTTGNLPTINSATTLSTTSIRVYWTRDVPDVTSDTVIVLFGTTIVSETVAPYLGTTNDSAVITGLQNSTPYTIIIGSTKGESQPYNYELQLTYLPTNVAITVVDSLSITVGWMRNFNDTSADTLYVTTQSGGLAGNSPIIVPAGKDTGIVTGLQPGMTYTITVVCATGSSTAIPYTVPGVPTSLMVNSMNATSIGAVWTRGLDDTIADTIFAIDTSGIITRSTPIIGDTGFVSGLSEGDRYTVCVHVRTGISDSITWMTAERTTGLKIYEVSDNVGDPRGLVLTSPVSAISLPGMKPPDLILDTNSTLPSGISLDAGDSAMMNGNATKINPNYTFILGGLSSNYNLTNYLSDALTDTVTPLVIPADSSYGMADSTHGGKGSLLFVCQTVAGNWALIEIVPDPNSHQLYSIAGNGFKYITVNVSYQAFANDPYAGRGHLRSAKPVLRKQVKTAKPVLRNSAITVRPVIKNPAH